MNGINEVPGEFLTHDIKGKGGVTIYKSEKSYNGYTLFCRNRGDCFYLIDMEGNIVHTWRPANSSIHFAQLLPNGHLFYSTADRAMEKRRGVHELDWDGNEVWYYNCPVDHDHRRLRNGNSIMLCREEIFNPEIYYLYADYQAVYSPYYIEVTPSKEIVWEWHGSQHIKDLKRFAGIKFPLHKKDWAHCNTCSPIPKKRSGQKDSRFQEGNIIFSYRELNTIGVIDKKSKRIVWTWGPGEILGQHDPIMLKNGHILLFDNGQHSEDVKRGYSRIIELDPLSGKITWEYKDNPPENFYSAAVSGQQELPNGNILVCSGGQGRIFEVTRGKEIVWEYVNPYYKPNGGNALYRHSGRYAPEMIEPLLP